MKQPIAFLAATLFVAGCGGSQSNSAPAPTRIEVGPEAVTEDQSFDLEEIEVQGMRFGPEALGYPPMPALSQGKKRPNVRRARAQAKKKDPKPVDVQLYVSILWSDSVAKQGKGDAAGAKAARDEVATLLASLRDQLGEKVDATTLEMSAVAAYIAGDLPAAITHYQALLERFPESDNALMQRTWLAYSLVRSKQAEEAAKVLGGVELDQATPETAYVMAWVAHRRGDHAGARAAIAAAARAWPDPQSWPAVERDMLLLLSRGDTPAADAAALFTEIARDDGARILTWLFNYSEGLKFAGYYQRAAETLEHILANPPAGQELAGEQTVGFRFRQADYAFRSNDAGNAATYAIAAHEALPACGEVCAGPTADAVVQRVTRLAQFFHTSYAASQDPAHYEAAKKLYEYYVAVPGRDDTETVRGYLQNLEDTRTNADPGNGKHSAEVMNNLVLSRREALAACYEARRGHEPELTGSVTVTFEVDAAGAVKGAATEPAGGAEGMAAVADCLSRRVRRWSFPSRTLPGTTTVKLPAHFVPREADAAAAPAPAEG